MPLSSDDWTLEPNAERDCLLPWLDEEPDPEVRGRVLEYLAGLLNNPFRPLLEHEEKGVFSLEAVPRTHTCLGWTLNMETKEVVLFQVG